MSRFQGLNRPNYWERLKILNLYSLQRRRERYAILYMWKILQGLVPNPGIEASTNPRTGINLRLPKINNSSPAWVQSLRQGSFNYRGSQLYNCLPIHLRQINLEQSLLSYKASLD